MTDQQKSLNDFAKQAIVDLSVICSHFDYNDPRHQQLDRAYKVLGQLLEQWRLAIGEPERIKPSLISNTLRRLADRIDSGVIDF